MNRWAAWLIMVFGAAHTIGALTVEGAGQYAGAWLSGQLRSESFAEMSPAMSAYWFSLESFGPALILLGATLLWMAQHKITPPVFIAWALLGWCIFDTIVLGFGVGQGIIPIAAIVLLLIANRRSRRTATAPANATAAVGR